MHRMRPAGAERGSSTSTAEARPSLSLAGVPPRLAPAGQTPFLSPVPRPTAPFIPRVSRSLACRAKTGTAFAQRSASTTSAPIAWPPVHGSTWTIREHVAARYGTP
jgi:hypothetical protein